MDQKIAFLSALHFLSENLSPVQDEAVRQLRVILSSFCGEVLSEDDYEYLVDSMREERYLAKQGSKVPLTREGVALVHAASERVLGQTALTRLKRMIGDYVREADAYVQRVSQQLRSLQEIRENKVKAANAVLIRVVGLIIGILHKCPDLLVHSFRLDQRIMRNEEFLDSEINYAARKFTGSTGYPIIAHRDNDVLQVTSYAEVASFSLLGQELKAFVIERVRREEVPGWNLQIASTILEDALRELA